MIDYGFKYWVEKKEKVSICALVCPDRVNLFLVRSVPFPTPLSFCMETFILASHAPHHQHRVKLICGMCQTTLAYITCLQQSQGP